MWITVHIKTSPCVRSVIKYEQAMRLHARSIEDYGGSHGVRDEEGLLAALGRPYATFDGELLYKDAFERAAAIGESIIMNHPFVDGNKRTGFGLMMHILEKAGIMLSTSSDEVYQFVVDLATGEIRFEEAVAWLRANTKPI